MNTALLVLRLVPGLLFIGHGTQKLLPARYSPALLRASGHRATADAFDGLGIHPSVLAAVLVGSSEVVGGVAFAAGLLTPIGTILIGAVMTTAILTVHLRQGIWNQDGGFEFPFVLLALSFVITALGPGSYSVNAWAHVSNWAGIDPSLSTAALAGIALAIGVGAGVLTTVVSRSARGAATRSTAEATVS
jgi:putative oxidoreductase